MTPTQGVNLTVLTGVKILLVEDEYFIAQDLCSALEIEGAQVIGPVADVASALSLISAGSVDAAVLDINLHGVVDFSVADELRQRGIPFVFATGYEPAVVPSTYNDVLIWRKPFDTAELVRSLREA